MTQPSLSVLCGLDRTLSTFGKNAPDIHEVVVAARDWLQYAMNEVVEGEVATSPPRPLIDWQQWAILRVAQMQEAKAARQRWDDREMEMLRTPHPMTPRRPLITPPPT